MAHSRSAWKRVRQNEVRRERNRAARSRLRTQMRKFLGMVKAGGDAARAQAEYRLTAAVLDKAALGGVIHRNKAARHKSRLAARLAALATKPG